MLGRPAETGQARSGQMPVPRQPFLECLVLAARPAQPLERGVFTDQILGEPVADLRPELLDLYHPCRLTYQALARVPDPQRSIDDDLSENHSRGSRPDRPRAARPRRSGDTGADVDVRRAAQPRPAGRRGDDRPGCPARRPGGDLVAEHLALGGGVPGHPLRRCGAGPVEHPLHRQRSHRHPGANRRSAVVRLRRVPGHRQGRQRGPRAAARAAAHRADPGGLGRRNVGGVRGPGRQRRADRGRRTFRGSRPRRCVRHPVHLRYHRAQ